MTDRPRRSKRQSQDTGPFRVPGQVSLPELKMDYAAPDDDNDNTAQTSEFVKRLHNMLEQNVYPGIIEWTQAGDAFVVKDMGAFISTVTPRQFKHSNFASFVRQLNKYDFHKIKASDADAIDEGKQAWVFRHPHFRAGGAAKLDLIKRKTPAQRKPTADNILHGHSHDSPGEDVREELDALRIAYQNVTADMGAMHRTMRQQRQLIGALYARLGEPMPPEPPSPDLTKRALPLGMVPSTPLSAAQAPPALLPRSNGRAGIDLGTLTVPSITTQRDWNVSPTDYAQSGIQWTRDPSQPDTPLTAESSAAAQQRERQQQQQPQQPQQQAQQNQAQQSSQSKQLLTIPGAQGQSSSSYTPMWSTKPRVLLVDDDIVSRTVSSKFLSVLGCNFDCAQDGIAALELMDRVQYDLVLMDIVMPRLDGLSATTRIRQFDARTPIISMTGNSQPADVVKYMSHGMNDVLCKPFTRDGLVNILEKHLIHLRAVWDLRSIPRSPGLPPMSDVHFSEALAAAPLAPGINLLASNGVADDEFASLLQGFGASAGTAAAFGLPILPPVGGAGKRAWDAIDSAVNDRDAFESKRPRFELVE